jgi:maltooligosyltrehalose trehalohydrolase
MGYQVGAVPLGDERVRFSVWAPQAQRLEVHLVEPDERTVALERGDHGVWSAVVDRVPAGALYRYRIDGDRERPDPASRHQPQDVHGPSQVVDPSFAWTDQGFRPVGLEDAVIYELHVGTFSEAGTFEGAVAHLDALCDLGVTHVELMPVAQFPGARNWGYDGVYPWAVQASYGGPHGLARLVDECHRRGLAVVLDVVYNHLGPEGNYLGEYGPYFTDRYHTPWGSALNFDGPWSDQVREYFIGSALYLARDLHIDAFRIDAVHAIFDMSARPFLQELADELHALGDRTGRRIDVIAESDLNDVRVLAPSEVGGFGHDAQWSDDFHHAVHALMTGEQAGYYRDFGALDEVARALRQGFLYTGQFSSHRHRRHGNAPHGLPGRRFVVCTQNHDQVGNRARGDRPSESLSAAAQRLQACVLFLSPYVPMLFMGQEYGETAPFQYFTSHTDPGLAEAVRNGRRQEFVAFGWDPQEIPDPQDPATFERSRLDRSSMEREPHRGLWQLHRELIALRRRLPALGRLEPTRCDTVAYPEQRAVVGRRWHDGDQVVFAFGFGDTPARVSLPLAEGSWRKILDSEDRRWGGSGGPAPAEVRAQGPTAIDVPAHACVVYAPAR